MFFHKTPIKFSVILALLLSLSASPTFALAETTTLINVAPYGEVEATSTPEATTTSEAETIAPTRELIAEPAIRVGLFKTTDPVRVTSPAAYNLYAGDTVLGALAPNEAAVFSYTKGVYTVKLPTATVTTSLPLQLVPEATDSFFIISSYNRKVAGRGPNNNFNTYRGTFEYRYSPKSKMPYIINQLPLEQYMKGITESSNDVPYEYAKALIIAARSYAFALMRPGKTTDSWLFDVYATTQDQLYLGYLSELKMPRIAQAATETSGQMVTYEGRPVITPYFSHTAGKTLTYKGKGRPWLKSVAAPHDKKRYKTMAGHGIGMSNYDASMRAGKDGWTAEEILGYYYTSTTVERVY